MSQKAAVNPELDLVLERVIDIPRAAAWRAWTTPSLLMQWFSPAPWKTIEAVVEPYPGGAFRTVMQSPEGAKHPGDGCVLEVVENEKLVWTSALSKGFRPTGDSFFTGTILLEDHPKGCKYTAHIQHKNAEDRKKHFEMGFETGWGLALDQLVALMKKN